MNPFVYLPTLVVGAGVGVAALRSSRARRAQLLGGVLAPALLQIVFVMATVRSSTGDGSFRALGVYLLSLLAVPATLLVNLAVWHLAPLRTLRWTVARGLLLAAGVPIAVLGWLLLPRR